MVLATSFQINQGLAIQVKSGVMRGNIQNGEFVLTREETSAAPRFNLK